MESIVENSSVNLFDVNCYQDSDNNCVEKGTKEVKRNHLYDIISAIFTDKNYINNLTEQQANQNIFMILRRIGINNPIQANEFNNNKVNALGVIKFFSDYLYCGYTPKWIYVSGSKSKEKKKANKNEITNKDIEEYCEYYGIDKKSFNFALKLFTEEAINDIKDFKSYMEKIKSKDEKNIDNE